MAERGAFLAPISREIWEQKYRFIVPGGDGAGPGMRLGPEAGDRDVLDTFERVGRAVASVEKGKKARAAWESRFVDAISDFGFLPAGRILAGAGTGREVTLFNCFVMGRIEDDLASIFDNVKEAALTMQQGGGIGHDFSTLRPKGALVRSIGADASGPVSFMDVWDAMCRTIMSAGARRGAMMATLRCDHPDIEAFIDAKSDPARLRNFNLSVLVTDAFMDAVARDAPWPLMFDGQVYLEIPARGLWERLMRATYDYAEPGVIFIDRVNRQNNLGYLEAIHATNPCGEQPLPPYGACLLGSINLTRFVTRPFSADAALDMAALDERVRTAVRFLDNVIDISNYPLPAQRHEAKAKRRIGLGLTGLADTLIMLGVRYGSDRAVQLAGDWMGAISRAAYLASSEIAREKGAFALFERERYLERPHVAALDPDVRKAIAKHGIRNGCLTSIAPTGTISLFAGNVSSGIEPVFDFRMRRRILDASGAAREEVLEDFAYAAYVRGGGDAAALPKAFVTAGDLSPHEHLRMQAAVQRHVDSSISKTINCPIEITFADFMSVYREAYDLGLKGCTTYRPNDVTGAVLSPVDADAPAGGELPVQDTVPPVTPLAVVPAAARAGAGGDIVYLSKPLERSPVLSGATYKLRWPDSDHALYITINDIEMEGGELGGPPRKRPFEIFINTRNLEHYAWTVALTRMISAVFRRGGDVSFVAEELKAVFDPQGGRFIGGRYVPSLLAAIGDVIETHMRAIGFLAPIEGEAPDGSVAAGAPESVRKVAGGRVCQRCGHATLTRREGCWVCAMCGFSRCG
ncbi:MAG: ribonucleoside-diphosphate reductase, adenosylcobalamin-dependent [Hyphomicrobium sp. 32-62-53]|nr:MAG: ribonucleoside-diphosphate reductase, adenosylcobalamin-dependent [Hyphomicrobium sp. 12-62-95]OYY01808.1 MAG: ribonucleoside-diphosphate reductase, adenosylcobalamin-dependent [Hyphomicrobium sp. 32-62-53]